VVFEDAVRLAKNQINAGNSVYIRAEGWTGSLKVRIVNGQPHLIKDEKDKGVYNAAYSTCWNVVMD
jgi:hypothetical protein